MIEFRFSTFLKFLLVVAAIIGGCDYLSRTDRLSARLSELKSQSLQIRQAVDERKQEWHGLQIASDKVKSILHREQELQKQQDALGQKQRSLEGQIYYLSAAMDEAVKQVRSQAIGTLLPELRIPDREFLRNTRILKIDDNSITFLHQDGVANLHLESSSLPQDMVVKYDLGESGISRHLHQLVQQMTP